MSSEESTFARELANFVPLALMFFLILFNYTVLKNVKDTVIVTQTEFGTEMIPFLKVYCNLPSAVIFTIYYQRLVSRFSMPVVLALCILPFLLFFTFFALVVFPARDALTLSDSWRPSFIPEVPFSLIRYGFYSLYYVFCELWGQVVSALLFWSLANAVSTSAEAKKTYSFFGIFGNVALIFAGTYCNMVSQYTADFEGKLQTLLLSVVVVGSLVAALGAYIYTTRLGTGAEDSSPSGKSKKQKLSLTQSYALLMKSSNIMSLAFLVICCGMCINLSDIMWKQQMRLAFPSPNQYSDAMGYVAVVTGVITICFMFAGRLILQHWPWGLAASSTPLMILVTTVAFALFKLTPSLQSPLILACIGGAQHVLIKASKYSLFDPTKELAFKSLKSENERTTGKAVVDVIGAPVGKSGGSFLQQVIILWLGSLDLASPFLLLAIFALLFFWFRSVHHLTNITSTPLVTAKEVDR